MGNPDADISRTRSIYEVCRDAYDDETGGNTDRRIEALRHAVGGLGRRVAALEAGAAPGKTPERVYLAKSPPPKRQRVAGRAPINETLQRGRP
jgi:hypothetical protein